MEQRYTCEDDRHLLKAIASLYGNRSNFTVFTYLGNSLCGVDHIHVTQDRENGKEPLGSITGREVLGQLCGCQLLNDRAI